MSMPKTPVHKHYCAKTRQHDVGLADEVLCMKPVTEARGKEFFAHVDLRQRVHPVYSSHHAGTLFPANLVGHVF